MFTDLPEGQTHSFNDGCGMPEHNDPVNCTSEKSFKEIRDRADIAIHNLKTLTRTDKTWIRAYAEDIPVLLKEIEDVELLRFGWEDTAKQWEMRARELGWK